MDYPRPFAGRIFRISQCAPAARITCGGMFACYSRPIVYDSKRTYVEQTRSGTGGWARDIHSTDPTKSCQTVALQARGSSSCPLTSLKAASAWKSESVIDL